MANRTTALFIYLPAYNKLGVLLIKGLLLILHKEEFVNPHIKTAYFSFRFVISSIRYRQGLLYIALLIY